MAITEWDCKFAPDDFVKGDDGSIWKISNIETTLSGQPLLAMIRRDVRRWVAFGSDSYRSLILATDAEILRDRLTANE